MVPVKVYSVSQSWKMFYQVYSCGMSYWTGILSIRNSSLPSTCALCMKRNLWRSELLGYKELTERHLYKAYWWFYNIGILITISHSYALRNFPLYYFCFAFFHTCLFILETEEVELAAGEEPKEGEKQKKKKKVSAMTF